MVSSPEPADAANPSTAGSEPLPAENDAAAYWMHPFTDDEMALSKIECWSEPEDWSDWLEQPYQPANHDPSPTVPSAGDAPA